MERTHRFILYLTNAHTLRSQRYAEQARQLVQQLTQGTGTLTVVDVDAHPERADSAGIILTPTLVRYWPLPVARLYGHLDDESQARRVLGSTSPCQL